MFQFLGFLLNNPTYLDLYFSKAYHPVIFNSIFNLIISSGDQHLDRKPGFAKKLFWTVANASTLNQSITDTACSYASGLKDVLVTTNQTIRTKLMKKQECQIILNVLDAEFSKKLCQLIIELSQPNSQNIEEAETFVCCMTEVVRLYLWLQDQKDIVLDTTHLSSFIVKLLQSLESMSSCLKDEPKAERRFSNGQDITCVGLFRYYMFELIANVLKLDAYLVAMNYDMSQSLLLVLQTYLRVNPWNNMVHGLVEQIAISLISKFENYAHYQQRYIGAKGFLGFLIQNFKNHDYLFLNSGNLSTYGNIHYLYNIATAVSVKLEQSEKLKTIMKSFEPWEKFIIEDLRKYEQTLELEMGEAENIVRSKKATTQKDSIKRLIIDINERESEGSSLNSRKDSLSAASLEQLTGRLQVASPTTFDKPNWDSSFSTDNKQQNKDNGKEKRNVSKSESKRNAVTQDQFYEVVNWHLGLIRDKKPSTRGSSNNLPK